MYDDQPENDTIACPFCGKPMYDDAEQCPACGQYVSSADFSRRLPTWMIVIIVLTILGFLMPYLATAWKMLAVIIELEKTSRLRE